MLMVRIRLRGPGDRQTEFILGLSKGKLTRDSQACSATEYRRPRAFHRQKNRLDHNWIEYRC